METPKEDRLIVVFQTLDKKGKGHLPSAKFIKILDRIGIGEAEAQKLILASNCQLADDNIEYGSFCTWLFKTQASLNKANEKTEPKLESEGKEDADVQAHTERLTDSGFGTWIDRCVHALEDQHEADYVHKKQLVTQMHAFMDHLQDIQESREKKVEKQAQRASLAGVLKARAVAKQVAARKKDAVATPKARMTLTSSLTNESYKPPVLQWDGVALMQKIMQDGPGSLPVSFVEQVLKEMLDVLPTLRCSQRAVLRFAAPDTGRVVVVGDTHGQLQDVLGIFMLQGIPTAQNVFLFNGNIADRGSEACSIFILLFVFLLGDPNCLVIHRGNHEDDHMNELSGRDGGGFLDECLKKYGAKGKAMYKSFIKIFKLLPLSSVVNDEIFITHGGLWRGPNQSLDFVRSINHKKVCCPTASASDIKDLAFLDLLWADPQENLGCCYNCQKYGIRWGPDVTEDFLALNDLKSIIRSKTMPKDNRGWSEHHLGRVCTIFSASNFMGQQHNWGAVAILKPGEDACLTVSIAEHNFPSLEALAPLLLVPSGKAREDACQEAGLTHVQNDQEALMERRIETTLQKLAYIVIEHKPELWKAFHELEPDGAIDCKRWLKVMASVCGEDLPWDGAAVHWFDDPNGILDYRDFLDKFQIKLSSNRWCGWRALVMRDVYHVLLGKESKPSEIFETFDPDGDGFVTQEEFEAVVSELTGKALTSSQLQALARTIFTHAKGGRYDIEEFLSRFTLASVQAENMGFDDDSLHRAKKCMLDPALQTILDQIGHLIYQRQTEESTEDEVTLSQTFKTFDDSNDGFLQVEEFVHHIKQLPGFDELRHDGKPLDDDNLKELADAIASAGGQSDDGQINLLEFYRAFEVVEHTLSTDLYEHILTFLYRHRHALRASCSTWDWEHAGRVSQEDFAGVLEALNLLTSRPERSLTQPQVDALSVCLSEDDGNVQYEEFLAAFEVEVLGNK